MSPVYSLLHPDLIRPLATHRHLADNKSIDFIIYTQRFNMKQLAFVLILSLFPMKHLWASSIFHLEKKKGQCHWLLYNVDKAQDKSYYKTENCPNQIVWLKDKSFYFSIGSDIFWANRWVKKPIKIVNYKTARLGVTSNREIIWGVKGRHNSIYALVIDPNLKQMAVNGKFSYEYKARGVASTSFSGSPAEDKAAGVIRRWLKSKKKWVTEKVKLVGRFNDIQYDQDLYNNSVLSSHQIIHYNECGDANCEALPASSGWNMEEWKRKLNVTDNGIDSLGYLELTQTSGILFKKALGETLHPVKPFILCKENCEEMSEMELPKSFADNYSMVKKGNLILVTNEDRGSVGNLYSFNSPKPVKSFRGPMVFWHPF